jgi:hypothetical protein
MNSPKLCIKTPKFSQKSTYGHYNAATPATPLLKKAMHQRYGGLQISLDSINAILIFPVLWGRPWRTARWKNKRPAFAGRRSINP